MPRRCPTCGEPAVNIAAFCGRCGARGSAGVGDGRSRRPARARHPRLRLTARIGRRRIVAAVTALTILGVLAAGLDLDQAAGEVTVPPTATSRDEGMSTAAAPASRGASPAPPPELLDCRADTSSSTGAPCIRWRRDRGPDQLVIADESAVYLAAGNGSLAALDRNTGAVRWNAMVGIGDLVEATVGSRGIVVAGTGGAVTGDVVAGLDPRDGTVRWTAPAGDAVELHSDREGVLLFEPGGLRQLDAATGAERWSWPTSDPAGVALIPGMGDEPVVSTDRTLAAIDPATGSPRWQIALPQLRGAASGGAGRLVAVDGGGGLVGIDERTGEITWTARLAFGNEAAVRIVGSDGLAVVEIAPPLADDGTRTPRVVGVDPGSGAVRWVHLYRSALERRGIALTPSHALLVGTSAPGTVAALELTTGGITWQRDLGPDPAHVRLVGDAMVAASGRRVALLDASTGRTIAEATSPAPVIGIVAADPGSAVLKTTRELLTIALR